MERKRGKGLDISYRKWSYRFRNAAGYKRASRLLAGSFACFGATPETLGFDRIAICVGAKSYYPGASLLVIDSGTCITYNYVSAEGVFLGGNISPGLEMRFNGLHRFTARLPLVTPTETYGGIGQSTEEAIRNGVMSGMLFEVQQYIECFLGQYPEGHVLITGGNAHFLERHLTPDILFCKYLSFVGLNEILKYVKKSNY